MRLATTTLILAACAAPALAQAPDGAAVYQKTCATCHANPAADSRAPSRETLRGFSPESIVTALTTGNMFRQAGELNDAEKRAVAEFLAGRAVGVAAPLSNVGRCTAPTPLMVDPTKGANWNGWGGTVTNTRYVAANGGLTAPICRG